MKSSQGAFKADLHMHTHHSFDSLAAPEEILKAAAKRNLSAIAITDHNEIAGAHETAALARQKKLHMQVIIGEEVATGKGDLLVYFLKKKIAPGSLESVLADVKKQGAICAAAHPYDKARHGIQLESLAPIILSKIDAIEAFNARVNLPSQNALALSFAQQKKKPVLAGSDAHHAFEVGACYTEFLGIKKLDRKNILAAPRIMGGRLSSPFVHAFSRYAVLKKKLAKLRKT